MSNSETLSNVGLLVGGLLAFVFALWRAWVAAKQADAAQRQSETGRLSLLNERYQRSAEMLGSSVLAVRIGAIHALERLAEDYPKQYHIQAMQLFCAFARNPVRYVGEELTMGEDVQAIVTAIGRRSEEGVSIEQETNNFQLDLSHTGLSGAILVGANLAGANLRGADLAGSNLTDANLSCSRLSGATLFSATCQRTNFSRANLEQASLVNADLEEADLSNAVLGTSDLNKAKLRGANLSGSVFGKATLPWGDTFARVTQRQLCEAVADPDTPPIIAEGTVDFKSGEPLVWAPKTCP